MKKRLLHLGCLLACPFFLVLVSGCGGTSNAPSFNVALPGTIQLGPGEQRSFVPYFENSNDRSMTWTIVEGAKGGSFNPTTLVYTAPATIGKKPDNTADDTFTLVAKPGNPDAPTRTVTIKINLSVSVDPTSKELPVNTAETILKTKGANPHAFTFSASVTGDGEFTGSDQVIWSVDGGTASGIIEDPRLPDGSPNPNWDPVNGVAGRYVPPITPGDYTIRAKSRLQGDKLATAVVRVKSGSSEIIIK